MSITPFPSQGQYPWYDQLEQWGADTQSAAENATIAADQVHADVAASVNAANQSALDAQAAQAAAVAAAGLVGAPAGDAIRAVVEFDLDTPDSGTSERLATKIGESVSRLPFSPVEGTPVLVANKNLQGVSAGVLYASTGLNVFALSGDTWTQVCVLPAGPEPRRFYELGNGEIIINRDTQLWKSSGWATSPSTATFRKVHEIPSENIGKTRFDQGWGVSVEGDKVLATEYGIHGFSRYAWYSSDSGDTFTTVFDYHDWPFGNQTGTGGAHMHGAGINPYDGTLFLVGGDAAPSTLFWADWDTPTIWEPIPHQPLQANGKKVLATPIVATKWGMVLTSDSDPDGVWYIRHSATRDYRIEFALTLRTGVPNNSVVGAHIHVENEETIWALFVQPNGHGAPFPPMIMAGSAPERMSVVWEDTDRVIPENAGFHVFPHGDFLYLGMYNQYLRLNRPAHGQPKNFNRDTGAVFGGKAITDGQSTATGIGAHAMATRSTALGGESTAEGTGSIAVGYKANANDQGGIAVGGSNGAAGSEATAGGPNSIAIGAYAKSTETSIALGVSAETALKGATAIGALSKATGSSSTAIGQSTTAGATGTVAIGHTATATVSRAIAIGDATEATHLGSVALGSYTVTSASNQVAVGARSLQFSTRTAEPVNTPEGAVEIFAKTVAGKVGLYARFPTGAVVGPFVAEA